MHIEAIMVYNLFDMLDDALFSERDGVLCYDGKPWTGYGPSKDYGYMTQCHWYDNGIRDIDGEHVPQTTFPPEGGITAHELRLSLEATLEEAALGLGDYATIYRNRCCKKCL